MFTTGQTFQLSCIASGRGTTIFKTTFSSKNYEFPDQLHEDFEKFFPKWPEYLGSDEFFSHRDWSVIQEVLSGRSCDWIIWTPKRISTCRFAVQLLGDKGPFQDELARFREMAQLTDRYVSRPGLGVLESIRIAPSARKKRMLPTALPV